MPGIERLVVGPMTGPGVQDEQVGPGAVCVSALMILVSRVSAAGALRACGEAVGRVPSQAEYDAWAASERGAERTATPEVPEEESGRRTLAVRPCRRIEGP